MLLLVFICQFMLSKENSHALTTNYPSRTLGMLVTNINSVNFKHT